MKKNLNYFLLGIILGGFFTFLINYFQKNLEEFFSAQILKPFEEMTFVNLKAKPKKPPLEIEAKAVLSLKINRFGREKILYRKNENQILPIASLTKLMVALVVLEDKEIYEFSKTKIISKEAENQENVREPRGNLKAGQKYTIGELFKLMIAYSSNDAAFALAEVIGTQNFVEKMNEKAKQLGLFNTHFFNPTGLDQDNFNLNYSTANDLIKLTKYLLENHPQVFEISLNGKVSSLLLKDGQQKVGGKTGFTERAGGSLIFIFKNEKGDTFINVILGTETKEARFTEMQKLVDWLNE